MCSSPVSVDDGAYTFATCGANDAGDGCKNGNACADDLDPAERTIRPIANKAGPLVHGTAADPAKAAPRAGGASSGGGH